MKKLITVLKITVPFLLVAFIGFRALPAHASFNQNLLMSDVVFDDYNSMNAGQIDSFLNNFPSSCLSVNNGNSFPDVTGYSPSTGFTYGNNVSAGNVIYHAAQAYGINPKVLLATLQKESSVVSGDASYHCQYINTAMGFDCPDRGSCPQNPSTESGFSKQIIHATWMLRFHEQRSKGNVAWQETKPGWDNSDDPQSCYSGRMTQGTYQLCPSGPSNYYDGWYTIDATATHMDSGATAALYDYTPHFSGNQHFVSLYESWFGSTTTNVPFAWDYVGQQVFSDAGMTQFFTSTATIAPGGTIYVKFQARNVGANVWLQNVAVGTSHPNNRVSQFYDRSNWLNSVRPAHLLESSVSPGQVGTFEFTMKAPATAGTYKEYFNPLIENVTWFNDPGLFFTINVVAPVAASNSINTSLVFGASLVPGQYLLSPDRQSIFILQTDGNLVLYSDFKAVWNSNTSGKKVNRVEMQSDGNLVLYATSDHSQAVWNSGTWGNPGAHLELQTDGNAVINASPTWTTSSTHIPNYLNYVNTTLYSGKLYPGQQLDTADQKYRLVLQSDGNLVLYSPNRATWSSGTWGKQVAFLSMQSDGNLVLYDNNIHAVWNSGTSWGGQSQLVMQADGNLVVYNAGGTTTWNSNTAGQQ